MQRRSREPGIGVADDCPRDEIVGGDAGTVLQAHALLGLAGILVIKVGRHHLGDRPRPSCVVDVEEITFLDGSDRVDHILGNDVRVTVIVVDTLGNRVTV
mgnify:CR=1 FL=1